MRPTVAGTTTGTLVHLAFRYAGANEHGHLYLSSLATPTSNIPMPTPLSEQHYNDDSSSEEPDAPRSLEDHLRVSTDVLYPYPNADAPQELQREASKLRAENRALKSTRPAKESQACSTASSVSLASHQEDDATIHGYRSAGKRFVLLSDLWPKESVLSLPYPPRLKSLGPWHSGRSASDAAWNEGNVAELYELLPERYHELIEHSALFADEVRGSNSVLIKDILLIIHSLWQARKAHELLSLISCERMPPGSLPSVLLLTLRCTPNPTTALRTRCSPTC